MTFIHICDKCGNSINLSDRINAHLPEHIRRAKRYHRIKDIETRSKRLLNQVYQHMWRPLGSRTKKRSLPKIGLLAPPYKQIVIDYEEVESEYSSKEEFWTMDEIIVTCPSCGKVDFLPAYPDKHVKMVPWIAMLRSRTEAQC